MMTSATNTFRNLFFSAALGGSLLCAGQLTAAPAAAAAGSATAAPAAGAPAAAQPTRLVSVGGAATEIVFALGAGDSVVGIDQSSVFPLQAQGLPQVGYVRTISAEGVLALEPQQIIASHEIGPRNAVSQIQASGLPVLILQKIDNAEDLYGSIRSVGNALGRQTEAETLIGTISEQFAAVKELPRTPTVAFLMKTPGSMRLSAAGKNTRAQDLIELAGGRNVVTNFNGYKALSQEALMSLQPDVIVVATPETFETLGTAEEIIADMKNQPTWSGINAARSGHVYAVGLGEALSFGPRMGEAVLKMNRILEKAATGQPAEGSAAAPAASAPAAATAAAAK